LIPFRGTLLDGFFDDEPERHGNVGAERLRRA
jgi:hypothetical protein